ncbi:hypothetical protein NW759_016558, partial [Fusarium solani]
MQPCFDEVPSSVPATWEERRIFYFLRTEAIAAFSGAFDRDFWTIQLLQASRIHPALWYAITALAGLYKSFRAIQEPGATRGTSEKYRILSTRQYSAAIKCLLKIDARADPSPIDKEVLLLATVLLTGLCSLRGDFKESFTHACNGLTLFHEWGFGEAIKRSPTDRHSRLFSASTLVMLFIRLDSQARTLMNDDKRPRWQWDSVLRRPLSREPFTSVTEAYLEFELLFNGLLELMQATDSTFTTAQRYPLPDGRHWYRQAFDVWRMKFFNLQSSLLFDKHSREARQILQIRLIVATIALNIDLSKSELCWDEFGVFFEQIVELSKHLLDYKEGPEWGTGACKQSAVPVFSFAPLVSEPLYFVASSCRDYTTRRKAISLLRKWPRREGIWDTTLAAKVA